MELIEQALNDNNHADDNYFQMLKDVGGIQAYQKLLEELDYDSLVRLHDTYGIGYHAGPPSDALSSKQDVVTTQAITDCEPYFPLLDRMQDYAISGHHVFIDAVGRPGAALKTYGPNEVITPGVRDGDCQAKVGNWGYSADQGGYLIANRLGGYGRRANLVPQNGSFNQGAWRVWERTVHQCWSLPRCPKLFGCVRFVQRSPNHFNHSVFDIHAIW